MRTWRCLRFRPRQSATESSCTSVSCTYSANCASTGDSTAQFLVWLFTRPLFCCDSYLWLDRHARCLCDDRCLTTRFKQVSPFVFSVVARMFAPSVGTMMNGAHAFATSGGTAWRRRQRRLRAFRDKQTSGCEDHKCAQMFRRVGGMMTDVHVAILSKPLHICEKEKVCCTGCESHVGVDLGAACASLN